MSLLGKMVGAGLGYAVAGPAGAVAGAVLSTQTRKDKGYDLSDVPMGVHAEVSWTEDHLGRRWSIAFLSALPPSAVASLRILDDAGTPLRGRPPFCDEAGHFSASATIENNQCMIYTPYGSAVYESPKYLSLEIAVRDHAHNAVGKAIADAKLPPPSPFDSEAYLEPFVQLVAYVLGSSQSQAAATKQLRSALGFLAKPVQPKTAAPSQETLRVAATHIAFRFPGIVKAEDVAALSEVLFLDSLELDTEETKRLLDVVQLLTAAVRD